MRVVLLVMALLAAPPSAAADWLQEGYDAARTGAVGGDAPTWNDVAYQVTLPTHTEFLLGDPVILDGQVYVMAPEGLWLPPRSSVSAVPPASHLYRIDLETSAVTEIAVVEWPMYHLASDGERLVGSGRNRIMTWGLDGTLQKSVDLGLVPTRTANAWNDVEICGAPAIMDGTVYVGCLDDSYERLTPFVASLRLDDLSVVWAKAIYEAESTAPQDFVESCQAGAGCGKVTTLPVPYHQLDLYSPPRISVVGSSIMVATGNILNLGASSSNDSPGYSVWGIYAMDRATGAINAVERSIEAAAPGVPYSTSVFAVPAPTGDGTALFTKNYYLTRYEGDRPRTSSPRTDVVFRNSYDGDLGSGFALDEDRLYVTSLRGVHAFDKGLDVISDFETVTLPESEAWAPGPLALTEDVLIAKAVRLNPFGVPESSVLYAFDVHTGRVQWRHVTDGLGQYAISDGLGVIVTRTATVEILGATPASLTPVARASTQYPQLDAPVEINLASSVPGLYGSATGFRADWGDGSQTDWQTDPLLTHRYSLSGDAQARFFIRNDHNQTASVPMTFYVGRDDPADTIFNSPFSDDHQEITFFLLGLALTAFVAAIGVYRAGRKRRRLERELRDLEADYTELKDDPVRCEGMLAQRRARARALFLERKLEEAHASFLVTRIDEIRHGLRINEVEQRLDFLPLGMVKALREILRDSTITQWERGQFIAALERDTFMSVEQKAKVQALIDTWFASDAALRA